MLALDGVGVRLSVGVTVLLGRNGAGKSTLSRVVAGVERPDTGELLRDGAPVATRAQLRDHLARTGWLPQAFRANGAMTVEQYVSYAAWLKGLKGKGLADAVGSALAECDLGDIRSRSLTQLSGGMLRRTGQAQAIVARADLLVLDEPTVGLDPEQRGAFHSLLRQLAAERAVLLSTHLLEDLVAMGTRVVVLDRGRVRFEGTTEELVSHGAGSEAAERLRSAFLRVASDEQTAPGQQLGPEEGGDH